MASIESRGGTARAAAPGPDAERVPGHRAGMRPRQTTAGHHRRHSDRRRSLPTGWQPSGRHQPGLAAAAPSPPWAWSPRIRPRRGARGSCGPSCGCRRYGPAASVARIQMAVFLARLLDYLVEDGGAVRPDLRDWYRIDALDGTQLTVTNLTEQPASIAGWRLYAVAGGPIAHVTADTPEIAAGRPRRSPSTSIQPTARSRGSSSCVTIWSATSTTSRPDSAGRQAGSWASSSATIPRRWAGDMPMPRAARVTRSSSRSSTCPSAAARMRHARTSDSWP